MAIFKILEYSYPYLFKTVINSSTTITLYSRLMYWTCLINTNLLTLWMVMTIYCTGSMQIFRTYLCLSWLKLIGYRWWMTNIVLKRFMKKKFIMTITSQHQVYGCVTRFINNQYSLLWNIYIGCLCIYPSITNTTLKWC